MDEDLIVLQISDSRVVGFSAMELIRRWETIQEQRSKTKLLADRFMLCRTFARRENDARPHEYYVSLDEQHFFCKICKTSLFQSQ